MFQTLTIKLNATIYNLHMLAYIFYLSILVIYEHRLDSAVMPFGGTVRLIFVGHSSPPPHPKKYEICGKNIIFYQII